MIHDDGLEIRREVDLDGLTRGELRERFRRQRGGAVLHRATKPVLRPRVVRQRLQRLEVELHLRDRAVGQHDAAMARAGLHGDLRNTGRGPQLLQRPVVAVHERLQLMHVAVLAADFADLRTDGNGDAVRLAVPDELRELGGALVVRPLLLVEIWLGEIDERGRIDVDVIEAGVQLLLDQRAQRLELRLGIGRVLLRVDLDMVALDEQRPRESLAQRRGRHHRDVLGGPLVGIGDLAPGDLADDRPGVESLRRPEDRPPGVVGENPDVDRGRGERRHVAPAPGQVQLVNRGGPNAGALPDLPDQPARLGPLVFVPEHGLAHHFVHPGALPDGGIVEFLEHEPPRGGIYAPGRSITSPSYAGSMPGGSFAARAACVFSCVRCVKNVRRAPTRCAAATASGTDRWSGWGRDSTALSTSTSSPANAVTTSAGIVFTSVRYATAPTR